MPVPFLPPAVSPKVTRAPPQQPTPAGNLQAFHQHLAAATKIRQRTSTQRLPRPAIDNHLVALEAERTGAAPLYPSPSR